MSSVRERHDHRSRTSAKLLIAATSPADAAASSQRRVPKAKTFEVAIPDQTLSDCVSFLGMLQKQWEALSVVFHVSIPRQILFQEEPSWLPFLYLLFLMMGCCSLIFLDV